MAKKSNTQIKNEARVKAFKALFTAILTQYDAYDVVQVGDAELAAVVDHTDDGEPIWATIKPIIKEFEARSTAKKDIDAYDGYTESENYKFEAARKAAEKAEKQAKKAAKIEKDKKARAEKQNENKKE